MDAVNPCAESEAIPGNGELHAVPAPLYST
jgi:hypothetical protein